MTKNIGPLNRDIPPYAEMTFNGEVVTHYMDVINLPEGTQRATCVTHLEAHASEMLAEFQLTGCHLQKQVRSQ